MEGVVAAILQRLLGHYVLGLERRNLRLAVWSGRVVLENLSLRPDALLGLVPAKLQVGTIGRLEMVVPWHKLGSMPVSLELHDVYVLATPLNEETSWRPEAEEARRWSKKQAALRTRGGELRELLAELQGSLETADDDSITPGLLGLILDNVQVTVSNVHLRYEDRINSSAPCALGVRLVGLHVKSIDEEGRTRFVERPPSKPVRKLAAVREVSAYLEVVLPASTAEGVPPAAASRSASAPSAGAGAHASTSATGGSSGAGAAAGAAAAAAARAASRIAAGAAADVAARPMLQPSGSPQVSGSLSATPADKAVSFVPPFATAITAPHPVTASGAASPSATPSSAPSPLSPLLTHREELSFAPSFAPIGWGASVRLVVEKPCFEVLAPLSGQLVLVFDTLRHRPPGVPALMVQADFEVAAFRIDHAQYLALNDLLHYALHIRVYISRLRFGARRPRASIMEASGEWWRYAKWAAVNEWGAFAAPLKQQTLRLRREYLVAYQESLLADLGGSPLSRHRQMRLVALERHNFSVGQVLAYLGLMASDDI
jgi:hypothetical protein